MLSFFSVKTVFHAYFMVTTMVLMVSLLKKVSKMSPEERKAFVKRIMDVDVKG